MAKKRKKGIPAVVPRIIFSTLFVGVVPACVASACGGISPSTASSEAGRESGFNVADQAFSVAAQCFGPNDPNCNQMGVAAVAFQCFDGSTQQGCPQPDAGTPDASDDGDVDGAG